jgi:serine/threonine protein kinase
VIESLHSFGIVHQDIKPEHFLIGVPPHDSHIFVVDFGFASFYRDHKTYKHIPCKRDQPLIGTHRYCSINSLEGITLSQHDDLESLAYVLLYFLRGSLPWQGVQGPSQCANKKAKSIINLCSNIPREFRTFLDYTRKLGFDDKPDYAYLRKLFQNLLLQEEHEDNFVYDWNIKASEYRDDCVDNVDKFDESTMYKRRCEHFLVWLMLLILRQY